ncbi:hypothetical protein F0U61_07770 [Archangium violaceum]|uniref:hypothetical protein n=1 Tax=Archangium violaceum TaxID=83451 RepID=UPI002B31916A|nr:hypothetical protein F0U61_07770 [Archangium violaceum]
MLLGTRAIRRSGPVLLVVLLLCLVARAAPGPQDDSIRGRLKACLLLGDMQCVVTQYMALKDLGRMPDWLVAFQNAFAVANRRAGECEKVARAIHRGLVRFAQKPVFIRFSVEGETKLLGFDVVERGVLVNNLQVSTTGHHVAVKLGDRVIDAYTGLAGLPLQQYMARLSTDSNSHVIQQVVEAL